jgi:hypothetical protein
MATNVIQVQPPEAGHQRVLKKPPNRPPTGASTMLGYQSPTGGETPPSNWGIHDFSSENVPPPRNWGIHHSYAKSEPPPSKWGMVHSFAESEPPPCYRGTLRPRPLQTSPSGKPNTPRDTPVRRDLAHAGLPAHAKSAHPRRQLSATQRNSEQPQWGTMWTPHGESSVGLSSPDGALGPLETAFGQAGTPPHGWGSPWRATPHRRIHPDDLAPKPQRLKQSRNHYQRNVSQRETSTRFSYSSGGKHANNTIGNWSRLPVSSYGFSPFFFNQQQSRVPCTHEGNSPSTRVPLTDDTMRGGGPPPWQSLPPTKQQYTLCSQGAH